MKRIELCIKTVLAVLFALISTSGHTADRPNILVIWGDDVGWFNISAYNRGMMGYRTPNIDRIANEGMLFTDAYGEQSCTAGRSAFITGQHPVRTGLTKVGMPGATVGLQKEDPTLAGYWGFSLVNGQKPLESPPLVGFQGVLLYRTGKNPSIERISSSRSGSFSLNSKV